MAVVKSDHARTHTQHVSMSADERRVSFHADTHDGRPATVCSICANYANPPVTCEFCKAVTCSRCRPLQKMCSVCFDADHAETRRAVGLLERKTRHNRYVARKRRAQRSAMEKPVDTCTYCAVNSQRIVDCVSCAARVCWWCLLVSWNGEVPTQLNEWTCVACLAVADLHARIADGGVTRTRSTSGSSLGTVVGYSSSEE